MSTWHEIPDEDIDIHWEMDEVNLLISSDDAGNNYSTLTFKQVIELANTIVDSVGE